jgi:RNA polymerase sigma-70 factor (ECF subfamily)
MLQEFSALTAPLPLCDDQLLVSARSGDDEALEQLIRQSWEPCMRVAKNLLRSSDEAADVLQTAFCRAFAHLDDFRGQSQFSTWVVRIVINQCMVRLRSSHYTRVLSYDYKPGAFERFFPDSRRDNDPEEGLASRQVAHTLRFELSRLPSFFRVPLELYYLDGLDLGEVAAKLDTTVMAVKSRLHRGRRHLRDRMTRHCGKFGGATLMARD